MWCYYSCAKKKKKKKVWKHKRGFGNADPNPHLTDLSSKCFKELKIVTFQIFPTQKIMSKLNIQYPLLYRLSKKIWDLSFNINSPNQWPCQKCNFLQSPILKWIK